MIDAGNGQGWDPKYLISLRETPASSATSRSTQASRDSPGSKNPANVENLFAGQIFWRPNKIRSSLSLTKTITALSVLG